MQLLVGLENNYEGRSLAWALDHPGCFSYGKDEAEALLNMPVAFLKYRDWLEEHAPNAWLHDLGDFDVRLTEVFNVYSIDEHFNRAGEGYEVNSWFQHDWKPLTRSEGQWATQMLAWTRQDLLDLARDLSPTQLERSYPGERWNIAGILRHVATAEWWYLERLDMAGLDRKEIAADPFEALKQVRTRLAEALPNLEGMSKVVGKDGEFWSPRKVVRRALWHERDHTFHILKLLQND